MTFGQRLRKLRMEKGATQKELADFIGVSDRVVGYYEADDRFPKEEELLLKIATYFDISVDYLLGISPVRNPYKESKVSPSLTAKDERDIAKKLSSILDEMNNSSDALMFEGEQIEMDKESQELLRSSIENSLRLAKRLAKEKYTPKKYRG